jgi:hypothetical protein
MTKVIFIATLWLLTALRVAGVPVTPAALEPRRELLDGSLILPPPFAFNRLDEVEFPVGSVPMSVEEWRPANENIPFPAADQAQRAAVLSSTSIEVTRRPHTQGRGERERRFGPQQKFPQGAGMAGSQTSPWLGLRPFRRRGVAGRNPNECTGSVARGRPLRWISKPA